MHESRHTGGQIRDPCLLSEDARMHIRRQDGTDNQLSSRCAPLSYIGRKDRFQERGCTKPDRMDFRSEAACLFSELARTRSKVPNGRTMEVGTSTPAGALLRRVARLRDLPPHNPSAKPDSASTHSLVALGAGMWMFVALAALLPASWQIPSSVIQAAGSLDFEGFCHHDMSKITKKASRP